MMSPRLDLSIAIVNWNTREMLSDCLTSVRAGLRGITAEVIVVDNASTDGSAGMVADAFPEVTLIRNAENRGFAAANYQAFDLARPGFQHEVQRLQTLGSTSKFPSFPEFLAISERFDGLGE